MNISNKILVVLLWYLWTKVQNSWDRKIGYWFWHTLYFSYSSYLLIRGHFWQTEFLCYMVLIRIKARSLLRCRPKNLDNSTNATLEYVGCPLDYEWCKTTPRVNMILLYSTIITTFGLGIPIIGISLDILYSKILGPIQQGTMQGVYSSAGIGLQIIGPIFLS